MNEDLNFKANLFFGRNWKFIFWGLILTILVMLWQLSRIQEKVESLEVTVAENNAKVVLVTSDGRAIKVTKTPLKAEYLKQYAVSAFINNFIVDRAVLTSGFQFNQFKKTSDVLKQSKGLTLIFTEYIDKEDKAAFGYFTSYLNWLLAAIGQDKLPEYVRMTDYNIQKYEYNDNTFDLAIDIKVAAQSFILAENKYVQQQGIIKISGTGTFDLEKSSDGNPFGMRINTFNIAMVSKDNK